MTLWVVACLFACQMGDFWTILSALIFGFHMLRSEHHARHVPEDGALPLIALQVLVFTNSCILLSLRFANMTRVSVGFAPLTVHCVIQELH